jgi:hypothetical protein
VHTTNTSSRRPRTIAFRLFSLVIVVSVAFSGCAWQSEALKVGDDTYQVSANASPARGGITGAREMALRESLNKRPVAAPAVL